MNFYNIFWIWGVVYRLTITNLVVRLRLKCYTLYMSKRDFRIQFNNPLNKFLNLVGNMFFCICVVIAIALMAFSNAITECIVVGSSMVPTLNKDTHLGNDTVFVNEYLRDFSYGDIVVVDLGEDSTPIIKRIIALEGDVVDVVENGDTYKIEINGMLIDEEYLRIDYSLEPKDQNGISITYRNMSEYLKESHPELFRSDGKLVVPDGHVFVLGDNRHDSKDSTFYGTFSYDQLMGEVELVRYGNEREFWFYVDYILKGKFFDTIKNCF